MICLANALFGLGANNIADVTPMKKKFSSIANYFLKIWKKLDSEFCEMEENNAENIDTYDTVWRIRGLEATGITYLVSGDFHNSSIYYRRSFEEMDIQGQGQNEVAHSIRLMCLCYTQIPLCHYKKALDTCLLDVQRCQEMDSDGLSSCEANILIAAVYANIGNISDGLVHYKLGFKEDYLKSKVYWH